MNLKQQSWRKSHIIKGLTNIISLLSNKYSINNLLFLILIIQIYPSTTNVVLTISKSQYIVSKKPLKVEAVLGNK